MLKFKQYLLEQSEETWPYCSHNYNNVYYNKKQIISDLKKRLLGYTENYDIDSNEKEIELAKRLNKSDIIWSIYFKKLFNDNVYLGLVADIVIEMIDQGVDGTVLKDVKKRDDLDVKKRDDLYDHIYDDINKVLYHSFLIITDQKLSEYVLMHHPTYYKHLFNVSDSMRNRFSHIFMGDKFNIFGDEND